MSCSKQSTINYLVNKKLVKPNLELYSPVITKRLSDTIDTLTKLAKTKYDVDMGPLFTVRYVDVNVGNYLILGASSVVVKSRLVPNDEAFEAIDRSPTVEENKLRREVEEHRMKKLAEITRDYENIQREGNFVLSEDGNIEVPTSMPKINITC